MRQIFNSIAESPSRFANRTLRALRYAWTEGIGFPCGQRTLGILGPTACRTGPSKRNVAHENGLTLIELIVTVSILSILAGAAVPITIFEVQRQKEKQLRYDLHQMRDAIDAYKNAGERGAFQIKIDTQGYPPDLDTLVSGVEVQGKKLQFLKKIPVDPMTGKAEWGMRSMQDDPTSTSFGGQSVFDVYSESEHVGLNGIKYSEW